MKLVPALLSFLGQGEVLHVTYMKTNPECLSSLFTICVGI